jgi:ribosome-associated translation inhibitor RaiA
MVVDITGEGIPRDEIDAARERVAALARFVDDPPESVRVTVRHMNPGSRRPYVADADAGYDGRSLAAHAAAPSPLEAVDEVTDRLRRQLRRVVGADVALRNEPRTIERALEDLDPDRGNRPEAELKPPEEREIVYYRTYADKPLWTEDAVAELLDRDLEFLLFRHAETDEDVVVYRRDDGRIGLIHPQGSALASKEQLAVSEPTRYSEPLTVDRARAEMDMVNHRFLYFVDGDDGRGKVLYLRHDGDYGLVEPAK